MARSNFATYAFTWENLTVMDSFENISSCGIEFGLYILKHFRNAPLYIYCFSNMVELRIFSWSYFVFVYNEETICCNLTLIKPFVLT